MVGNTQQRGRIANHRTANVQQTNGGVEKWSFDSMEERLRRDGTDKNGTVHYYSYVTFELGLR